MVKKDIRLYTYCDGQLYKVGIYRTGRKKYQRHFFDSVEQAREQVNEIMYETNTYDDGTQFLIVEYFSESKGRSSDLSSKIIEIINK